IEDRRDLDPAPPDRPPAAAAAAPPETEMGGPGAPGGLLTLIPEPRRHEQHLLVTPDTILRWHRGIVRRRWAATSRTRHDRRASYPPGHQGPGPPAGPREPRLGLPQDPWRTGRAGGTSPGIDSMGDLEKCGHRSRAAAERAGVAAVPALPGRGDRGVRLLHSRPSRWHPGLCPGRDRARQPAHQDSRSHFASHWIADRPASPKPADGPRRAGTSGQVHDPRPRLELHRCIRRGPRRCRDPDRALQRPDPPDERDRRTLDRRMPPRAPGPHARLEPGPSAADLAGVRDPPQSAPATPPPGRSCTAETSTGTGRSRAAPCPETDSHRLPHQRIPPGRITWTRFSARTGPGTAARL